MPFPSLSALGSVNRGGFDLHLKWPLSTALQESNDRRGLLGLLAKLSSQAEPSSILTLYRRCYSCSGPEILNNTPSGMITSMLCSVSLLSVALRLAALLHAGSR